MSRIVLTRYPNGQERFVVGYDHPCHGCFWQEFNLEPDDWNEAPEDWEEVLRYAGMWRGIPLDEFRDNLPPDLAPLVTDQVMALLRAHSLDPDSGYNARSIDLSH